MSQPVHYPELNERDILMVVKLMKFTPDYLENSPYSQALRDVFKPPQIGPFTENTADDDDVENPTIKDGDTKTMLEQTIKVYNKLQEFGEGAEKSADKSTFFRLSVSLLDQLISLRERASNLNDHEMFVAAVLQTMEDVLNADQRTEFKERLKRFTEKDV